MYTVNIFQRGTYSRYMSVEIIPRILITFKFNLSRSVNESVRYPI